MKNNTNSVYISQIIRYYEINTALKKKRGG